MMTFEEKIKMLNDYAAAWYSSSQADYLHEAIFREQGFGKFADLCKEESEEELEEARKCTERVVKLGGKPVFGCVEQPVFCEVPDLLKDWDNGFKEQKGVEELEKIAANPKVEICAFKGGKWIRIAGELVNDDSRDVKVAMLEKMPSLKGMYSPDDGNMQMLYFKNAVATFSSFTEEAETVTF